MASKREQVADALLALVRGVLPDGKVSRNAGKPSSIAPGGNAILRDGDPGEPEVTLSPTLYTYTHRFGLDVAAYPSATQPPETVLDVILTGIGAAIAADPTLGGLCEYVECEAPSAEDLDVYGAPSAGWAEAGIVAIYDTPRPL